MTKPDADPLLNDLEAFVRKTLKHKNREDRPDDIVSVSDRIKAAEIGAKLVLARHKVDGTGGSDKPFFGGNGADKHA